MADITGTVHAGTDATLDSAGLGRRLRMTTVRTDEELMLAFRSGERDAFADLFERYQAPVTRFFRRRVSDQARADELAQETFLGVIQAARRYQPSAAFRSYLFGVAYNVLMAWRRKARRRGEETMAELDPPAPEADPDRVLWVRRALAALDPTDREVLMLREYEQLSYDEIAGAIGVPTGTVRSRLFRARMALREKLVGQPQPLGAER
jgi:RNA polymerase sigma-70 factor (ECF subfamily)